jgi:hypothetical protein
MLVTILRRANDAAAAQRSADRGIKIALAFEGNRQDLNLPFAGLCQPDEVRSKLAHEPVKESRANEWSWTTSNEGKVK